MNYEKGFSRITLIISLLSVIIGLFYGINKFSLYYNEYKTNLESHNNYYSSMIKLLNGNINNSPPDSLLARLIKIREQEGEPPPYHKEKIFKVNKMLINKNNLNSTTDNKYISIEMIIDSGINKKLDESIKNEIANKYANANVSILLPWKEAVIYILLIPLFLGSLIWIIYYTVKFIVAGFQN